MITQSRSVAGSVVLVLCALAFVFPPRVPGADQTGGEAPRSRRSSIGSEAQAATGPADKKTADPYAQEVTRRGNLVIVSRKLADAVKRDNRIVLSKVAVKGRLNREGELQAWELVQVDRGSVVEKMGFRPADLVTTVNGIRARDFNDERQSLESSDRFKVTIVRKGKARNLIVEIR